jgi:hypothetical protein
MVKKRSAKVEGLDGLMYRVRQCCSYFHIRLLVIESTRCLGRSKLILFDCPSANTVVKAKATLLCRCDQRNGGLMCLSFHRRVFGQDMEEVHRSGSDSGSQKHTDNRTRR